VERALGLAKERPLVAIVAESSAMVGVVFVDQTHPERHSPVIVSSVPLTNLRTDGLVNHQYLRLCLMTESVPCVQEKCYNNENKRKRGFGGFIGSQRCDEINARGYLRLSLLSLEQGLLQIVHTLHH
jgi:hypothetical protein